MNEIRYLLDENVDPVVRSALLKREPKITVWKIGDPSAPPKGTSDPEILKLCEENFFLLLTHNRKTMPRHLKAHLVGGGHIPGIFALNPNMNVGEIVDELLLI